MKILFLLLAMLALFACQAQSQAREIDFKGVPFGASEKEFSTKHPSYRCKEIKEEYFVTGDRHCYTHGLPKRSYQDPKTPGGTFAGVAADIYVNFFGDRLETVSVWFFSKDFYIVFAALSSRYGNPVDFKTRTVTNRMGAEFKNTIAIWRRGDVTLTASRYGSSLDKGQVRYTTEWVREEQTRRSNATQEKKAGDL